MKVVTNAPGTPASGYRAVGNINATNSRQFRPTENAMDAAIDIGSNRAGGGPVVGEDSSWMYE